MNGQGLLSAQRTIRVANVRNGIRRLTFRTERDNKEQPMAIVLVDIQVLDLEEVNKRVERCKTDLEASVESNVKVQEHYAHLYLPWTCSHNASKVQPVTDFIFVLFYIFDISFSKEARCKEGLSDLSRKEREAIKCIKKNNEEEVFIHGSRFLSIIETLIK